MGEASLKRVGIPLWVGEFDSRIIYFLLIPPRCN
jgi:hypothetical protein